MKSQNHNFSAVCVPWPLDEGSKDQSKTIVMVLDGSAVVVEQHRNTLFGLVPWSNTNGSCKGNFHILPPVDVKF
jgi:hypothetical protein